MLNFECRMPVVSRCQVTVSEFGTTTVSDGVAGKSQVGTATVRERRRIKN